MADDTDRLLDAVDALRQMARARLSALEGELRDSQRTTAGAAAEVQHLQRRVAELEEELAEQRRVSSIVALRNENARLAEQLRTMQLRTRSGGSLSSRGCS